MADNKVARTFTSVDLADWNAWQTREAGILTGKIIPTPADRRAGHGPFSGSAPVDLRQVIAIELDRDQAPEAALEAMKSCSLVPDADHAFAAYRLLEDAGQSSTAGIFLWHAAIRGHEEAAQIMVADLSRQRRRGSDVAAAMGAATAFGLLQISGTKPGDRMEADEMEEVRDIGFGRMSVLGRAEALHRHLKDADAEETEKAIKTGLNAALQDLAEDRSEIVRDEIPDFVEEEPEIGLTQIVVPASVLQQPDGKNKKEILASLEGIAGKQLRLVEPPPMAGVRAELREAFPHLHGVIDRLVNVQVGRAFSHSLVLLVGPPGAGKTSLAVAYTQSLGQDHVVFNAGAAADSSFGGTPIQWQSSTVSIPLRLIAASKQPNPCVIIDEVDKCATSRTNGNFADTLLGFLEPSSSVRYFDPALQSPVDLSAVSYICTANTLEDVPMPLRDRLHVVRVPEPTWEHVGPLSKRIIDELAKKRGLDPRWIEPLAQDEMQIVHDAWPGGSLRQLTKILTTLLDGRDRFMGRA